MICRETRQRVASTLKITSRVAVNPESASSGNIATINIKTRNESQSITPEDILLRALKLSDSKTGEQETRSTRLLRPSRTYFQYLLISGVKLVFPQGRKCCIPPHQDSEGTFWGIFILNDSLLYLFICIRPLFESCLYLCTGARGSVVG
jgi:hypothetical protein